MLRSPEVLAALADAPVVFDGDEAARRRFDVMIVIGSALPALLWGVAGLFVIYFAIDPIKDALGVS